MPLQFRHLFAPTAVVLVGFFASRLELRADTIKVFNATGTFDDGAALSGTVTINTTTGLVTAADLFASSPDNFEFALYPGIDFNGEGPNSLDLVVETPRTPTSGVPPFIKLVLGTSSLIGYQGGPLGSDADPVNGQYVSSISYGSSRSVFDNPFLAKGALTAVPEPSSVFLSLCFLLGLGGHRSVQRAPKAT